MAAGLMDTSLFNLPEEPVRNLDFEAHGRKTAAEACVVTVAISFPAGIGQREWIFEFRVVVVVGVLNENVHVCAWPLYIS